MSSRINFIRIKKLCFFSYEAIFLYSAYLKIDITSIYLLMKKQSIYLPTLSSLYLQQVNYRMHRYKLNNSKRSYQNSNTLSISNSAISLPKQVILLKNQMSSSRIRKIRSKILLKYHTDAMAQRKISNLSPFQRKKLSELKNQNQRIQQILIASKCSGYGRSKSSIQNYQVLRKRISKYIHEGKSVNYKFKKSLLQISKRKVLTQQSRDQYLRESIVDEAKKLIVKSRLKEQINKKKNKIESGIYLQTMRTENSNPSTKRQSAIRIKVDQYQSLNLHGQNNELLVDKKQPENKQLNGVQSISKTQNKQTKKSLLDYIAQIKIKKKQKIHQEITVPKSMLVNLKKSNLKDLQVVQFQSYKNNNQNLKQIKN